MVEELVLLWPDHTLAFWMLLAAAGYLLVVGTGLSWIDLRTHRLPNRIVFPAYAVSSVLLLAASLAGHDGAVFWRVLAGGALLWAFYFTIRFAYPAGMGFGDVKLAGVLGMYLGYLGFEYLLWGTFASFLLGGAYGLLLVLLRRGTLSSHIPFGPFMVAGTWVALLLPT
jgi:leader peptidase (prepilin peptidase) / N-methyltransferase